MSGIVYYIIRYLPPKTTGQGEIVIGFTHGAYDGDAQRIDVDVTLEKARELYPDAFQKKGFYTLMKGTGETLTV